MDGHRIVHPDWMRPLGLGRCLAMQRVKCMPTCLSVTLLVTIFVSVACLESIPLSFLPAWGLISPSARCLGGFLSGGMGGAKCG